MPSHFGQLLLFFFVTLLVTLDFVRPVINVGFRQSKILAPIMTMPEAAINEHTCAVLPQHNVGMAGKPWIVQSLDNGFGWKNLPKSFMSENTVFLLITAMIRNFYTLLLQNESLKPFGLKPTSRIKAFVFKFISVPAKWIRTARSYRLNIYTDIKEYATVFKTEFG